MRQTMWMVAAGAVVCAAAVAPVQAKEPLERLTAFAVDMSVTPDARVNSTRAGVIDVIIDRWSTTVERDRLKGAIVEGGPDLLLKELQKIDDPAGQIMTPGNIGTPLRFAWQSELPDGGRRLLIATDRRIGFFEAVNKPRSSDYPFMLLDIRLDAKGEGTGKLLPIARVRVNDENVIEVENYASEPVRLTKVRVVK